MKDRLRAAAAIALQLVGAVDIRDVIGLAGFGLVAAGVLIEFGPGWACIVAGVAMVGFTICAVRKP